MEHAHLTLYLFTHTEAYSRTLYLVTRIYSGHYDLVFSKQKLERYGRMAHAVTVTSRGQTMNQCARHCQFQPQRAVTCKTYDLHNSDTKHAICLFFLLVLLPGGCVPAAVQTRGCR